MKEAICLTWLVNHRGVMEFYTSYGPSNVSSRNVIELTKILFICSFHIQRNQSLGPGGADLHLRWSILFALVKDRLKKTW